MNIQTQLLYRLEQEKGTFLSGASLAQELHCSRNAIWKAIQNLKSEGYQITSVPNRGYRLLSENDILSPEAVLGYLDRKNVSITILPSVPSTSQKLKKLALDQMPPEGSFVLANAQTAGRGHVGHSFYSPADCGLYISVLLRPTSPVDIRDILSKASVAACRAVEKLYGISLLIFAGIVDRIPSAIRSIYTQYTSGNMTLITIILLVIAAILVIAGVVLIQEGQRKIPVQYAKRVVGRKMYGGQSTHIPVKVNQSGVIPIIFALSLLQFPLTITYFLNSDSGFTAFVSKWLSPSGNPGVWVYGVLNVLLIIFFTYFYNQITFNPVEIADNLKSNGGFIPGIRPGKATSDYLAKVTSRITIVGAIFLAAIATLPTILSAFTSLNIHFGGTSLLIAVGVALETVRVLENQMMMRNYQGFLK